MGYYHLNIHERTVISQLHTSGVSIRGIAEAIRRSPSTVSRELKRNSYRTGRNHQISRYIPRRHRDLIYSARPIAEERGNVKVMFYHM